MKLKLIFVVFSVIMFTGCISIDEVESLKKTIETLNTTNKKIQEQINNLTIEKEELNKKMRILENENKNLKDELQGLKKRSENVTTLF